MRGVCEQFEPGMEQARREQRIALWQLALRANVTEL
jgi:hypothetical protein